MKKLLLSLFLLVNIFATGLPAQANAQEPPGDIRVQVDALPVAFDVKPAIQAGRTLVPFRALAEALNVLVSWDGATQTVSARDGKTTLVMSIGSATAYRSGNPFTLDVPPVLLDGRTLIPARVFSEAFGCRVEWTAESRTVKIYSPAAPMAVTGFYALGDSQASSWTDLFGKAYPLTGPGSTDLVSRLALGWYSLDRTGSLLTASRTGWQRPEGWESVLKAASDYKMKTEMVVHLTDGDGTLSALLASQPAAARAVSGIVKEAGRYQGVNLDFEGLGWQEEGSRLAATRDSFSNFVRLLSVPLKAAGIDLTLTLHAPNSAYRGYDYSALGKLAGRIIIMAYDYGPRPEPEELVIQAVEAARASVPPEKLILGISTPAETPESIIAKVGIAKRYGLGGIALWRLGLVRDEMWSALRTTIKGRN
ncbi:MAG: stalk domain-containing protein [Desulfocucumaceae bacterium]